MRALLIVLLSLVAIVLVPTSAFGQAPEADGMWFGGGAGYGITMLSCGICSDEIRTGPSLHLKAGGKLSQSVLIGAETSAWMKRREDVDQFVFSVHATGYLYTAGTRGLFLKGGIGPTWFLANDRDDDGDLGSLGVSLQFGVGYDATIGENSAVTPYLTVVGSGFGKLSVDDRVAADQFGVAQVHLGLSFTTF